jgi:hypothetical protein
MSLSRRKFLAATPLAVGAILPIKGLALDSLSAARSAASRLEEQLSRLTWDSFYPYITTNFAFSGNGATTDLTLTKMADTRPQGFRATGPGQECFSLTFLSPGKRALVQDVFQVEHFALGRFDLFITVVGKAKRGTLYEAVINRIAG